LRGGGLWPESPIAFPNIRSFEDLLDLLAIDSFAICTRL
jgi:hypothetical protein